MKDVYSKKHISHTNRENKKMSQHKDFCTFEEDIEQIKQGSWKSGEGEL